MGSYAYSKDKLPELTQRMMKLLEQGGFMNAEILIEKVAAMIEKEPKQIIDPVPDYDEIFSSLCKQYNISWDTATEKEKSFHKRSNKSYLRSSIGEGKRNPLRPDSSVVHSAGLKECFGDIFTFRNAARLLYDKGAIITVGSRSQSLEITEVSTGISVEIPLICCFISYI